jgi:alpha-glucosidase
MHFRSGGVDPGRDGCRVPIPWSGDAPPYGFTSSNVDTWLPQPADWARYAADRQGSDPDSMLALYRAGLRLRHEIADLTDQPLSWLDLGGPVSNQVIAFRRGSAFASVTNLTASAVDLPSSARILLASTTVEGGRLPADATAWLELA